MAKGRKRNDSASVIDQPVQSPDAPTSDALGPNTPGSPESPDTDDPRDRIAMRAYELYLARGGSDGGDFDDWLAAEREITAGNGNASRGDAGE